MRKSPVIIATGGANLASLKLALGRLGADVPVTEDPEEIRNATHVILPGVGAARDAMTRLNESGLDRIIPTLKQPVLGICLGMQLLFTSSDEDNTPCLGIVTGVAHKFKAMPELPVPQMGWNQLEILAPSRLLASIGSGEYAYFLHSYALPVGPYTRAAADYGGAFSAVIEHGNFFGAQFHPERSAKLGARLLRNFLEL